jgi:aldose 1-epimerase
MSAFSISHEGEGLEHVAILRDEEHGSEVRVAVGYGFNVFSFKVPTGSGVADVLYAEEGFPRADLRATANGTPILVPFPNRIAGGKFTYDGKSYTLPCNDHGVNAIHGFAFDKPWRIIEEETDEGWARIVGEFAMLRDSSFTEEHWPGNFRVRCDLKLEEQKLSQRFAVENLSDVQIPFGLGIHPYFRLPLSGQGSLADCSIFSPNKTLVELDATIPTGATKAVAGEHDLRKPTPIGARFFDTVFTDVESTGCLKLHKLSEDAKRLSAIMRHDDEFLFIVVYIPPHRNALCIEPYTCVTNAVNLGDRLDRSGLPTGLWHLTPSEVRTVALDVLLVDNNAETFGRDVELVS